jgi:hypothetical protein
MNKKIRLFCILMAFAPLAHAQLFTKQAQFVNIDNFLASAIFDLSSGNKAHLLKGESNKEDKELLFYPIMPTGAQYVYISNQSHPYSYASNANQNETNGYIKVGFILNKVNGGVLTKAQVITGIKDVINNSNIGKQLFKQETKLKTYNVYSDIMWRQAAPFKLLGSKALTPAQLEETNKNLVEIFKDYEICVILREPSVLDYDKIVIPNTPVVELHIFLQMKIKPVTDKLGNIDLKNLKYLVYKRDDKFLANNEGDKNQEEPVATEGTKSYNGHIDMTNFTATKTLTMAQKHAKKIDTEQLNNAEDVLADVFKNKEKPFDKSNSGIFVSKKIVDAINNANGKSFKINNRKADVVTDENKLIFPILYAEASYNSSSWEDMKDAAKSPQIVGHAQVKTFRVEASRLDWSLYGRKFNFFEITYLDNKEFPLILKVIGQKGDYIGSELYVNERHEDNRIMYVLERLEGKN